MNCKKVEINLLFETSWEVCNKVGGIYTVLSTKAKSLQTLYKNKVIFIGPDVWTKDSPCNEFKESKTLLRKWREEASLPFGISVRVGRWEIPGRPIAILIKFDKLYSVKNEFYGEMWNRFGVDSLHAYGDYDEACTFALASGMVIESIVNYAESKTQNAKIDHNHTTQPYIAHFDEWTTGMGLLYVKSRVPQVATVFTTHATSIGRSICGNGKELYRYFRGYNGDQMARELNMEAKHSLEKAAAHNADAFTTVSDITAEECEQLLQIRPHIVTPNGFEDDFVPNSAGLKRLKSTARKKILEVVNALTDAQLGEETFIIGTAGRCEYRNKGLDMFIDSVQRLSCMNLDRRVLALVLVPAWVKEPRADLLENIHNKKIVPLDNPFITHNLNNFYEDRVVGHIRRHGFTNNSESKAVVVYVPCYLDGKDGIFDKTYYHMLCGMDATVFPSYYEPWGYTPLESIAFGVPTVTTTLSGFGRWAIAGQLNNIMQSGIAVTKRNDTTYETSCDDIATTLHSLINADSVQLSEVAKSTAKKALWQYFIKYYIDTYKQALKNLQLRNNPKH